MLELSTLQLYKIFSKIKVIEKGLERKEKVDNKKEGTELTAPPSHTTPPQR